MFLRHGWGLQASDRPDQCAIVDRLLLFVGEEKKEDEGIEAAKKDVADKFAGGFPELFYRKIEWIPTYAASGNTFVRGTLDCKNGHVSL